MREDNVGALDVESGEAWLVTDLTGRPGRFGGVMCTDGKQVWFTWQEERGDLWMVDVDFGSAR